MTCSTSSFLHFFFPHEIKEKPCSTEYKCRRIKWISYQSCAICLLSMDRCQKSRKCYQKMGGWQNERLFLISQKMILNIMVHPWLLRRTIISHFTLHVKNNAVHKSWKRKKIVFTASQFTQFLAINETPALCGSRKYPYPHIKDGY